MVDLRRNPRQEAPACPTPRPSARPLLQEPRARCGMYTGSDPPQGQEGQERRVCATAGGWGWGAEPRQGLWKLRSGSPHRHQHLGGCSLAGVPASPSLGRCRGGGEGAAVGAPDPDRGALLVPRGLPYARLGPPHKSRWWGGPLHQPERDGGAGCFRAGSLRREWHTRPSGTEGRKRRTLGVPVRLLSPLVPSSSDPTCQQQQKRGVLGTGIN